MAQHYLSESTLTPSAAKIQIQPLARRPKLPAKSPSPGKTESRNPSSLPVRHSRHGRPKVKTGCITCKIRRVKCDETKPDCGRCTSTGRKCDGYLTPAQKEPASESDADGQELALGNFLNWEQGDPAERRAIDFFRSRTAPSVASYFDADFWSHLVLQVSQSEPAVMHALAAVGALNERRDAFLRDVTYTNMTVFDDSQETDALTRRPQQQHNDPFALSQYNKAITHLAKAMSSPSSNSIDTALLVCILFVCVECLRGDYEPALKHFRGGMSIALAAAGQGGPNSRSSQATGVREKLVPFFNRLELLGQVYGERPNYAYGLEPSETLPQTFTSIVQARDSIVHIMNLSIRLIHSVKLRRYRNTITPADRAQQTELITSLSAWKAALDRFLLTNQNQNQNPPSSRSRLQEAATILQVQQTVARTWLHRALSPFESAADADIPLYAHAVALAESLPAPSSTPTTFLFDMEIVSPLYLVAIKCRHPLIRRRAIALLRRSVRREGLWDSVKAAAVAERIVEIEEAGLSSQELEAGVLPAEEVRVANAKIRSGVGLEPIGHRVTFFTMPEGVRGRWRCWGEWIVLRR